MADDMAEAKLADRQIPKGDDWLSRAELSTLTAQELIRRTTALKPLIMAKSREAELLRRPHDEVWAELRKTGIFYHFVPKAYGGLELDVEAFIDVMLPVSEACASTGWTSTFCVEHNWMLALFPQKGQEEIFGSFPYVVAPAVTNPPGQATPVPGGYRLSGRWKWGTGVMHADWLLATGAIVGESPPQMVMFAFPASEATVIDTWHVDGMAGTGSNDFAVKDIFVPEHRAVEFLRIREGRAPGSALHANPMYRMPMLPFLAIAATIPAVGAAKGAVANFRDRLHERVVFGADQKQADKPAAQIRLAQADVMASTAELLIRKVARMNLRLAERDTPATVEERVALRARVAYAMSLSRNAIQIVCDASGASAHYLENPLQRALRDVNVMAGHVVHDLDAAMELHGRAMVGLPPNSPIN